MPYLVYSQKGFELLRRKFTPLSDRIHLTSPNGAESARNLSVAVTSTVLLLFFRKYTNTAPEKSCVNSRHYL